MAKVGEKLQALPALQGHHILVCGPTGSGKSHTLAYLIALRADVTVCDPHYLPGSWPKHCKIAGAGRNYAEIQQVLEEFEEVLNIRYQQRAKGKSDFAAMTLVIDETPAICAEVKIASQILKKIAREGRKVGVFIMVGAQGMTVVDLDIRGSGNMRENFVVVKLAGIPTAQERSAERIATVIIGDEQFEYYVPREIPERAAKNPSKKSVPDRVSVSSSPAQKYPIARHVVHTRCIACNEHSVRLRIRWAVLLVFAIVAALALFAHITIAALLVLMLYVFAFYGVCPKHS